MKQKIGIIGFGYMGSAIAERIKSKYTVYVSDKDKTKTNNLQKINITETLADLVDKADVVILAVKPQDFDAVLAEIKEYTDKKLVISIAAGIRTRYIEKFLGDARIMRTMPNMPAKIGKGITCLAQGKSAAKTDLNLAQKLFSYLGKTLKIKEEAMNAVTAVSGSGPAYVCYYLELEKQNFLADFRKAAESVGFSSKEAKFLVQATYFGTIDFLKKTKILPSELRKQITSKGGTTEAALEVLGRGGSLEEAVKAALVRAEELEKRSE